MESVTAPADTGHVLVIERVLDAPPAMVFRLWSDPQRVKAWWHPEGFETTRFDMDFRVGGSYRFTTVSGASAHGAHGVYREIVASQRIVMSFQWDTASAETEGATLITITFAPQGEKRTLLTFRQEPFVSGADRDEHGKGWGQVLDAFAVALAGGRS